MIRTFLLVFAVGALAATQNDPNCGQCHHAARREQQPDQALPYFGLKNRFIRIRMSALTEVDASGGTVSWTQKQYKLRRPCPRQQVWRRGRMDETSEANLELGRGVLHVDFHLQLYSSRF
jgi:hypothetical protein